MRHHFFLCILKQFEIVFNYLNTRLYEDRYDEGSEQFEQNS